METIFSLAFITTLANFLSGLKTANKKKRDDLAAYLNVIAECLEEISKTAANRTIPNAACERLKVASERAPGIFKDMVGPEEFHEIVASIRRGQTSPGDLVLALKKGDQIDESSIEKLEKAAGRLRGIADALKAPQPNRPLPDTGAAGRPSRAPRPSRRPGK
jgi:hypothetical protein